MSTCDIRCRVCGKTFGVGELIMYQSDGPCATPLPTHGRCVPITYVSFQPGPPSPGNPEVM